MKQLVYVSFAREEFTEAELDALLAKSRANNEARGLTGMLLYHKGDFLQVLEGPGEKVDTAFDIIARDPRHDRVMVLDESEVPERSFGDWSMGFSRVEGADIPSGFVDFFDRRFDDAALAARGSEAMEYLSSFKAIAR